MKEWLSGKKTYIVSWTGIIAGAASLIGAVLSGEMSLMQMLGSEQLQMILEFAGLGGLRAGLAKLIFGK